MIRWLPSLLPRSQLLRGRNTCCPAPLLLLFQLRARRRCRRHRRTRRCHRFSRPSRCNKLRSSIRASPPSRRRRLRVHRGFPAPHLPQGRLRGPRHRLHRSRHPRCHLFRLYHLRYRRYCRCHQRRSAAMNRLHRCGRLSRRCRARRGPSCRRHRHHHHRCGFATQAATAGGTGTVRRRSTCPRVPQCHGSGHWTIA